MAFDNLALFAQAPGIAVAGEVHRELKPEAAAALTLAVWVLFLLIHAIVLRSAAKSICDIKLPLPAATGFSFVAWIVTAVVEFFIERAGQNLLWFNWPQPEVIPIAAVTICSLFAWLVIQTTVYGLMIRDRRRQPIGLSKGFQVALMVVWIILVIFATIVLLIVVFALLVRFIDSIVQSMRS